MKYFCLLLLLASWNLCWEKVSCYPKHESNLSKSLVGVGVMAMEDFIFSDV